MLDVRRSTFDVRRSVWRSLFGVRFSILDYQFWMLLPR